MENTSLKRQIYEKVAKKNEEQRGEKEDTRFFRFLFPTKSIDNQQ